MLRSKLFAGDFPLVRLVTQYPSCLFLSALTKHWEHFSIILAQRLNPLCGFKTVQILMSGNVCFVPAHYTDKFFKVCTISVQLFVEVCNFWHKSEMQLANCFSAAC